MGYCPSLSGGFCCYRCSFLLIFFLLYWQWDARWFLLGPCLTRGNLVSELCSIAKMQFSLVDEVEISSPLFKIYFVSR